MVKERDLGLPRFEASVACGEYLVGSHGDGLCSASLRRGELACSMDVVGDPVRRVIDVAKLDDATVVAAGVDGSLSTWRVEQGKCAVAERYEIGSRPLLVSAAGNHECFVLLLGFGMVTNGGKDPKHLDGKQKEGNARKKRKAPSDVVVEKTSEAVLELACWSLAEKQRAFVVDAGLPRRKFTPVRDGLVTVRVGGTRRKLVFCGKLELRVYAIEDASSASSSSSSSNARLEASATLRDYPACALAVSAGSDDLDSAWIATGHASGEIRVWHSAFGGGGVDDGARGLGPCRILHWHATRVGALCSTANYLLSGGDEAVMVVWQFARGDKESNTFLPRLGGPIVSITEASLDDASPLAVVVTAENAIHVIAVTQDLARVWSLRGLCVVPPPLVTSKKPGGRTVAERVFERKRQKVMKRLAKTNGLSSREPRRRLFACTVATESSSRVAVNARSGCLDVFDPVDDRVVATIDVVPHNRVRSVLAEDPREPVVLVARFSPDGKWLATLDAWVPMFPGRRDSSLIGLVDDVNVQELKFWRDTGGWAVEATVRAPHGRADVRDIACYHSTTSVGFATAADDGTLKLWCKDNDKWTCTFASGAEDTVEDGRASAVVVSGDSSLAAVAYGAKVALWNLEERAISAVVRAPGPPLRLAFGPCLELLGATCGGVAVWDLQACAVAWTVNCDVVAADINPAGTVVAVVPKTARAVVLFSYDNPQPVSSVRIRGKEDPHALVFLPDDNLLVFKSKYLVHVIQRDEVVADIEQQQQQQQQQQNDEREPPSASRTPLFVDDHEKQGQVRGGITTLRHLSTRLLDPNPRWSADADDAPTVDLIFDAYLRSQFRL